MEITLIDNVLNKSEAKYLIRRFIEEKLNFHKLRRLSITEGDAKADISWDSERIEYLEEKLKTLKADMEDLPESFEVECTAFFDEPLDNEDEDIPFD